MKRHLTYLLATPLIFTAGCASESLFFSTKTSVGIDISATNGSPRGNIGYDRTEAAIVPAKADGSAHSVLGGLDADLSLFDVRIKQIFATGKAADLAADHVGKATPGTNSAPADKAPATTEAAAGKKLGQPIVFATDASLSLLNIQIDNNGLPGSGSTLYRRSEATLIPIKPGQDEVASVYADISIDTSGKDQNKPDSGYSWIEKEVGEHPTRFDRAGVRIVQSFATGSAAEKLVKRDDIKAKLTKIATNSDPGYTDSKVSQAKNDLRQMLNNEQSTGKIQAFFDWVQATYPNSKAGDYKEGKAGDYFSGHVMPRLTSADILSVSDKAKQMLK